MIRSPQRPGSCLARHAATPGSVNGSWGTPRLIKHELMKRLTKRGDKWFVLLPLLMIAVTIAMWVRGNYFYDDFHVDTYFSSKHIIFGAGGVRYFFLDADYGTGTHGGPLHLTQPVQTWSAEWTTTQAVVPDTEDEPPFTRDMLFNGYHTPLPAWTNGIPSGYYTESPPHYDGGQVTVPYSLILVLVAIGPVVLRGLGWWRDRRRRRLGLCLGCGYDLRASTGQCPECGVPILAKT